MWQGPGKQRTRQCESGKDGLTWEVAPMSVVASNRFRAHDEETVLSCTLPGKAKKVCLLFVTTAPSLYPNVSQYAELRAQIVQGLPTAVLRLS